MYYQSATVHPDSELTKIQYTSKAHSTQDHIPYIPMATFPRKSPWIGYRSPCKEVAAQSAEGTEGGWIGETTLVPQSAISSPGWGNNTQGLN